MTPPTVAQRYVDAVNSGRVGDLESIFAPDVVFRSSAVFIDGLDDVIDYFIEVVFLGQSALHLVEEFASPRGHVARIDVRSPLAADLPPLEIFVHFETDDNGLITRFDSFHRFDPSVEVDLF
ncbi:MAG: nuclear transport factor 2 family protein [Actinobacteria bacterium]|nr:nuclear transport factor 2 family protein [Actinomycetota bacterium]